MLSADSRRRSPTRLRPCGGGTGSPGVTRYITVPCAGTVAAIVSAVVRFCRVHRSLRVYEAEPPSPIASAVVVTVRAAAVSLVRVTERPPSARGLVMTTSPPERETTVPWRPSGSWFTAMTSRLVRISRVAGVAVRRSLPMRSGAAICDQRLKWVRYSVSVIPPLPTSSMSGSFQAPGRAYGASSWLRRA
ncbi:Hypothetical protein SCLAV_5016, partial [Streptomyces clavuligerus]